jgi:DNA-directed RNA polymerase specialized sigma24 family protein
VTALIVRSADSGLPAGARQEHATVGGRGGPSRVGLVADDVLPLRGPTPGPDDAEVGRRFAAGDEQALAIAYERWSGQVHGMAVRAFGPGPDAEDITQQVFVSAWTGRTGYRPESGPLPAWLVGVCRHKIADTWARRDRQRRLAEAAAAGPGTRPAATSRPLDSAVADRVMLLD